MLGEVRSRWHMALVAVTTHWIARFAARRCKEEEMKLFFELLEQAMRDPGQNRELHIINEIIHKPKNYRIAEAVEHMEQMFQRRRLLHRWYWYVSQLVPHELSSVYYIRMDDDDGEGDLSMQICLRKMWLGVQYDVQRYDVIAVDPDQTNIIDCAWGDEESPTVQ